MSSSAASTTVSEFSSPKTMMSTSLSFLVQHVSDNNNNDVNNNTDTMPLLLNIRDSDSPQLHRQSHCQHQDDDDDDDDDNSFSLPSSADDSGSASTATTTDDEKRKTDDDDNDDSDSSSSSLLSSTARTDKYEQANEENSDVDDSTTVAVHQEEDTCPQQKQQQQRAQPPFTITSATSMRRLFPSPPQETRFLSIKNKKIQNQSESESSSSATSVSVLRSDHYYQMVLNREYYDILSQSQVRKWESEHLSARQEYDNLIFAAHIRNIQRERASRPEEAGSFSPWGASVSYFGGGGNGGDGFSAPPPFLQTSTNTNQS